MKKLNTLIIIYFTFISFTFSQMWNGVDTLYGNEWINYNQQYFKIMVTDDGIHRLSLQDLQNQGIPTNNIQNDEYKVFSNGLEIPIYVSNNEYIEFYGEKNHGKLDAYLFQDSESEQANPKYSMFTDTSTYFLTWESGSTNNQFANTPNNLNTAPSTSSPFCLHKELKIFGETWNKKKYAQAVFHSDFQIGEGFVSPFSTSQTIPLEPKFIYTSGPSSILNLRYTSQANPGNNVLEHKQSITVGSMVVAEDSFFDVEVKQHEFTLNTSDLESPTNITFEGLINANDKQGVAYIELTYPREFDFDDLESFKFSMPMSTAAQLLEIQNFSTSSNPILYDLTNNRRIEATLSGSIIKIALPPLPTESEFILINNNSGIINISEITPTNFIDYSQTDAEFIIISNKALFNDAGTNWVQEYADYRSSANGGNYSSLVVDVEELYEQFAYGVNRHPISIRNFGHYIKKSWSNPKYVFLIGKGREYHTVRTPDNLMNAGNTFLIPTYGSKGGSDNLLLGSNFSRVPILPIGRIAATSPKEVKLYLDKVIGQEESQAQPQNIDNRSWMKRIVHMGGGSSSEQPRFKSYLENFSNIVENNSFGAEVSSFYKTTSDPVQISTGDQIKNLINEGVSIITFFGHASVNGFDFSLDNAELYDNEGRYPVMFSFGCYSGIIHSSAKGVSENFVLTEKKGAIAFFASTGLGFEGSLKVYGDEFYNLLGGSSYGLGIGDITKRTLENTESSIGFLTGQMTLHGDPAIRLDVGPGPDFIIDENSVKFNPSPISIQQDSFDLSFDICNVGKTSNTDIVLEIKQQLPNSIEIKHITDTISPPRNRTTYNYRFATLGPQSLGRNKFFIDVDILNSVPESPLPDAENNNSLVNSQGDNGVDVYFISNEVTPVYPREFGIVNNPNLTLKASTSSAFIESQNFYIQIDTTETFDSPFFKEKQLVQKGGVLKWKPNISYSNNTVYYWRVSPEQDPNVGGFTWKTSSFVYIAGSNEGWNQSHYYQFQKDKYVNMELPSTRKFKYIDNFKDLQMTNFGIVPGTGLFIRIFLNNTRIERYIAQPPAGVFIIVLDPVNAEPMVNPTGNQFGELNYYNWTLNGFPFFTRETSERANVINFLENEIPDDSYVLFFTGQEKSKSYEPEEWAADNNILGTSIFDVLENEGAAQVRNLENTGSIPYIFFYQKGVGSLEEAIANNIDDVISLSYSIPGNWDEGFIESTIIGPAKNWESLQWQVSSIDNIPTDNYSIDIIGVNNIGNETIIQQGVQSLDTSLVGINAIDFPYLKLKFNSRDSIQRSSPQLDYWRVLYEGLPEAALNPDLHFSFDKDSVQQGEPIHLEFAIENIDDYNMDSLLLEYRIVDSDNNQNTIVKRLKPLLTNDSLVASLTLDTRNLSNKNTIFVEANPNDDQLEQFHFNNLGFIDFYVEKDKRNPILDVTFDGFHIMDGDMVSSKPNIMITLKDENQYLTLDDTSSIRVFLQSPYSSDLKKIFIDGDTLAFYPAIPGSNNKAQLEFKPHLLQSGKYTLLVQAEDISNNQSGQLDYKVSFEISTFSSISKVLNYPNPFSTSTKFVFTITGDEIPEQMKIQILTISGNIVREITMAELGPIHVGNNITEFSWDGTDEFGDKLANGVYLYKVVATKANGETFEPFNSKADQFFKNGFGKMVILR